jgi:hypothetical protein
MRCLCRRRSIRLGPSTWQRTATSTPRTGELELHLEGKLEANQSDAEELTCCGLAYLDRIPRDEW